MGAARRVAVGKNCLHSGGRALTSNQNQIQFKFKIPSPTIDCLEDVGYRLELCNYIMLCSFTSSRVAQNCWFSQSVVELLKTSRIRMATGRPAMWSDQGRPAPYAPPAPATTPTGYGNAAGWGSAPWAGHSQPSPQWGQPHAWSPTTSWSHSGPSWGGWGGHVPARAPPSFEPPPTVANSSKGMSKGNPNPPSFEPPSTDANSSKGKSKGKPVSSTQNVARQNRPPARRSPSGSDSDRSRSPIRGSSETEEKKRDFVPMGGRNWRKLYPDADHHDVELVWGMKLPRTIPVTIESGAQKQRQQGWIR